MPPVLRDWHNHFDNYGNFMPGYCGGISLGDWRELARLLDEGIDTEAKPVLTFLVTDDMEGLFRFAQEHGYEESAGGYVSKCDLCLDIRRHLAAQGEFEELRPKEFYGYA